MMDLPTEMRAVLLTGHGGLDKLQLAENWPVPTAPKNGYLIKVHACGMNNTDINTRTGWYSRGVTDGTTAEGGSEGFEAAEEGAASWGRAGIAFPRIQGADVCGTVVAAGNGADLSFVGKRVMIDTWLRDWDDPLNNDKAGYYGSECDGGYAEYTTAPATNVHPLECDLTHSEVASFATSYITAENLLHQAKVGNGDVVLIPGASGGVGSALIQLCLRRGAVPVAMSGPSKADAVKALGAAAVLDREPEDLAAALQASIGRDNVDVVADVVGGPMFKQFLEVLVPRGRYTCAGAIAAPIVEFDLRTFYLKDLVFTGATVVPPGLFKDLVGYIERGEIKPLVAATYPLAEIQAAQTAFLQKKHVGNIVIKVE